MGKRGCWGCFLCFRQNKHYFFDIWEKWGRHIWGKEVVGIVFRVFRQNKHYFFDIWKKWGRHIWEKGVAGIVFCVLF